LPATVPRRGIYLVWRCPPTRRSPHQYYIFSFPLGVFGFPRNSDRFTNSSATLPISLPLPAIHPLPSRHREDVVFENFSTSRHKQTGSLATLWLTNDHGSTNSF
jgi:hypothetical protein